MNIRNIQASGGWDIEMKKTEPASNDDVSAIIRYWYDRLAFPRKFDEAFDRLIRDINVPETITVDEYDIKCTDGGRNLLSFLYFCSETADNCRKRGIPENIITETLGDIVKWTEVWSEVKGYLCLYELEWLKRHLSCKLFRLGRLQFCMCGAERNIPEYGVILGDPIMEIHIPAGEHLTEEGCQSSVRLAKDFFATYFPNYNYSVFTCHSWLLDTELNEFLPSDSGIIRFGNMFDRVYSESSNAIIRYLFSWDTTVSNVVEQIPTSSLAKKVRNAVLDGRTFHETLGVLKTR